MDKFVETLKPLVWGSCDVMWNYIVYGSGSVVQDVSHCCCQAARPLDGRAEGGRSPEVLALTADSQALTAFCWHFVGLFHLFHLFHQVPFATLHRPPEP